MKYFIYITSVDYIEKYIVLDLFNKRMKRRNNVRTKETMNTI